ncbi:MAG: hypothetical protein J6A29_01575 [Clostridia bacterium]|nr:hypothetical protein [Clostridia bacterium]
MNQTLEHETFEEVSNYKLTFENKENLDNLITEEINSEGTDEMSSTTEDINIEEENNIEECTSLVTLKEHRLLAAQTMFKKSIKISIKSFLISLSLSFLNLFI